MEYPTNLTFKWGATGTSITVPCTLIRIGCQVTFFMMAWGSSIQNTTGTTIGLITTTQFPSCFYPATSTTGTDIITFTNVSIISGANTVIMWYVRSGQGYINMAPVSGGWANLTTVQAYGCCFSWSVINA